MGSALKLLAGFNLIDLFPALRPAKVIGGRSLREARQVHARLDRMVKSIIHTHAQAMAADREKEDLLHILLRLQKGGGLKTTLTTDVISSTLFELFSAGSETTMTTITWAMSELMRNPHAMEGAQAEIRQLLQGKAKVREEDIERATHLLADGDQGDTSVASAGGAGRRMCPGLMFGLSNIELTLATLLYHFDWKLPNGASSTELDMSESQGINGA
ncbi:hypothetical protein PR202_ga17261 [Eleusine coracana subsp. coracana]|uniref:Uncharacterized protein n=1 Tax=Eleusine coracana subsp. coracana TaxID=191504 RepID=A0AAV5CQE1_ELECO|nr:hypothetical protein PR202_ga17261 [Eleusine coracana subsp. coracana]